MKCSFLNWFRERFLPEWARQQLMRENKMLRDELERKEKDVERLEAYIQGVHAGMREKKIQQRLDIAVEKGRKGDRA